MLDEQVVKNGLYYEGRVSSVYDILELYKRHTVTTWGQGHLSILKVIKLHLTILRDKEKAVTHTFKMHYTTCTITKKGEGGSHSMKGCQSLQVTRK